MKNRALDLDNIIKIKKNDINPGSNVLFGVHYEIKNTITNINGDVVVHFCKPLSSPDSYVTEKITHYGKVIDRYKPYALINSFYPNDDYGYDEDSPFYRIGIGRFVLKRVLSNIKSKNYNIVFANSSPSSIGFYSKNGFNNIRESECMYKYLNR